MQLVLKGMPGVCLGLLTALGGCGNVEKSEEPIATTRQAFSWDPLPEEDTLEAYAAKCDAATGVHVPTFDCNQGVQVDGDPSWPGEPTFAFIDQGSSYDNIQGDIDIGITGGLRDQPEGQVAPDTVQIITAGGGGIPAPGTENDELYFSYTTHGAPGKAEVLIRDMDDLSGLAGLMIRANFDGADTDAANALVAVTQDQIVFQQRLAAGGNTTVSASVDRPEFPFWLRLAWTFQDDLSTVVAAQYAEEDDYGVWTQVGDTWVSPYDPEDHLPFTTAVVGLAVSSTTATFDDFRTTKMCDTPNALYGLCDPGATFQVLERTADAIVVANCRKGSYFENESFSDIAVIQYNRKNGAVCFYQSDDAAEAVPLDGTNVTAPSLGIGAGRFAWLTPAETHSKGCTGCHDNGALIRSPFLWQTGLLPDFSPSKNLGYDNDGSNPLSYVGTAFKDDKSWFVEPGGACSYCHQLAVSNVQTFVGWSGTADHFSLVATSVDQMTPHKNPAGEYSRLWMPFSCSGPGADCYSHPGPSEFSVAWANIAQRYSACAQEARGPLPEAGFQTVPYDNPLDCEFVPFSQAYLPPIDNLSEGRVATEGGDGAGNFEQLTLTSAPNSDMTEDSDDFYWLYKIHPGDGAAIVRVDSLTNTHEWAKAGIMFRDGSAPDAAHALLAVTPGPTRGVTFQHRTAPGEEALHEELTGVDLGAGPVWLKLERSNRTFVAYVSTDERASWTQVGQPITLQTNFTDHHVGLVTTTNRAAPTGTTGQAVFKWFDWIEATGWTRPPNPHRLADASIGDTAFGARKEWITQETLYSGGGDIWNGSDDFFYSFKSFAGDGHVETRLLSLTAKDGGPAEQWAKAGLMIRETAAADARHVLIGKIAGGAGQSDRVTFQYRQSAGQLPIEWQSGSVPNVPISFRLRRAGDTFSAAYKPDGAAQWTEVPSTTTLAGFSDLPLFGLAVSSHETDAEAKAVFDSQKLLVVDEDQEPILPEVEPPGFHWISYEQGENNHMPCLGIAEDLDQDFDEAEGTCEEVGTAANRTITATGGPIFGASDQFVLSAQAFPGPVTIQAKVTLLGDEYTHPSAKAGLMIRNDATPSSPNVMMGVTRSQGAAFQYRTTAGGNTSFPGFTVGAAPIWLRLERTQNNVFKGYTSPDGVNWSLIHSVTLNGIGQTPLVGLAVSSRNPNLPVRVEFTDFSISLGGSTQNPCASFCANPTSFSFENNYQSGNLGTGSVCRETTESVAGGNCGNFVGGRQLRVNGVQMTCNYQNWTSVPAPVAGGYCVEVTSGNHPWAYFTLFE